MLSVYQYIDNYMSFNVHDEKKNEEKKKRNIKRNSRE